MILLQIPANPVDPLSASGISGQFLPVKHAKLLKTIRPVAKPTAQLRTRRNLFHPFIQTGLLFFDSAWPTSDQPKSVSHLRGQVVHRSVSISIDKPFPHPPVFKLLYQSVKKPIPAQMSFNLTRAGVVWGAVYPSENEAGSKKEKIISANIWESPTISVLLPFLVSLLTSLDKTVYVHIFTNNSWFKHVINVVNISFFDSDKQKKHP